MDNQIKENNNHADAILHTLAEDYMQEKKRKRRWGLFFKFIALLIILALAYQLAMQRIEDRSVKLMAHTALIDVNGSIMGDHKANADSIGKSLRLAFENENSKGLILRVNSPGGSAVQASYIFQEIQRLRKQYPDKKLYAVCTDMCGSAGYYIAAAADYIYANPASMIGSIGVIYNGFGFTGTMEKVGVQRRLVTAGKYKSFMDPFSPKNDDEEQRLQVMLDNIHQIFIQNVKKGRGGRLQDNPMLYSGLLWDGQQALELGLIDGMGSAGYVARELIKEEKIVNYTKRPGYLERFSKQFGMAFSDMVVEKAGLKSGLNL